ncbi:MAG: TldD/PmbA family protein [Nitrospirota bacterium]
MDENELMDAALAAAGILKAKGIAGYDVYVRGSAASSAEVKEQKLDAFEEARTWGVGIRALLPDGRMGFAFSTGSADAAREAALKAAQNAENSEPDEMNAVPAPPIDPFPDFTDFDDSLSKLTEEDKIGYAMTLEDAARRFDGRITKVRSASASFTEAWWVLVNSNGVKAQSKGTYVGCGIMAVAEDGGDSQMGYGFESGRRVDRLDFRAVGTDAAFRAISLLGARKPPSGSFPVILENYIAPDFLGVLAASFSGEALIKGRSMLPGKLGKKICSELIGIYDDGLLPGGTASRSFDDEGVPSQTTPLVEGGVLRGFLHSTYTARKAGAVSTGNAVRGGFRSGPMVGATNLYIRAGASTRDSMITSVSSGLIVQEVLGMHTANPVSGDFSVGVSGQWIEGGKVAYPVREAAIAGNILSVFSEVEAVGDDLRFQGRAGSPTILLRPISVSGS